MEVYVLFKLKEHLFQPQRQVFFLELGIFDLFFITIVHKYKLSLNLIQQHHISKSE